MKILPIKRSDPFTTKKFETETGRTFLYTHKKGNLLGYIDPPDVKPFRWYIKNIKGDTLIRVDNCEQDHESALRDMMHRMEEIRNEN